MNDQAVWFLSASLLTDNKQNSPFFYNDCLLRTNQQSLVGRWGMRYKEGRLSENT